MTWPADVTRCRIAGQLTPGICALTDVQRTFGFDTKKARGEAGEYDVATGEKNAEFTLTIELYDEDDLSEWLVFAPVVTEAPKDKALDFWHPTTQAAGITSVTVRNVTAPTAREPGGPLVVVVKLKRFTPKPKESLGRPKGGAAKPGATTVKDEQDKEIDRLLEQERNLSRRNQQ